VVAFGSVSEEVSPQSTLTVHGASFTPGSLKLPRLKLVEVPSLAVWSAGAVTTGGLFKTVTCAVSVPVARSSSVTVTVTV
jgi:hypothetical protein